MEGWPLLQNHPPAIESLSNILMPVLVINGDKDLPYLLENSAWLAKTIPGAKRITIKDVAHMLNMEKPGDLNKAILDFLKEK